MLYKTASLVKALLLYMIAKSQNSIFDTPTYIALLLSLFSTHLLRTSDYTRYHDLSKKTMRNEFHSALHIFQDHNDFYGMYLEISRTVI